MVPTRCRQGADSRGECEGKHGGLEYEWHGLRPSRLKRHSDISIGVRKLIPGARLAFRGSRYAFSVTFSIPALGTSGRPGGATTRTASWKSKTAKPSASSTRIATARSSRRSTTPHSPPGMVSRWGRASRTAGSVAPPYSSSATLEVSAKML